MPTDSFIRKRVGNRRIEFRISGSARDYSLARDRISEEHKKYYLLVEGSMNHIKKTILKTAVILFVAVLSPGCMSWEEGWKSVEQPSSKGDVKALLAEAEKKKSEADTKEKVLEFLKVYESVIRIEPGNYEALYNLGDFYFLVGYGYAADMKEKDKYYIKAARYCERAMYTNPGFKKLADAGKPVWEACGALTKNEMGALYFWYMAVGNKWKECQGFFGRLATWYWPSRAMKVLKAMTKIAPDWNFGNVQFAWAAFYSVAPGFLGGDLQKADEYFKKAIKAGPDRLNYPFVRAMFYHAKKGDREGFKKDLNSIIARDLRKIDYPYPWAVYYRKAAKEMLEQMDKYF